jgi:alpha-beta hydrolase superfamily lysophospholipase
LTLKPSSLNEFGHHGFVGFLLALDELPVMTCDNAVTKPHIGRVLSFSQQLKFRGAFSVQPHAHKTVQYGHGTSRQNADKYENEFYVKNPQSAFSFPTFLHMYPHNQRVALALQKSYPHAHHLI